MHATEIELVWGVPLAAGGGARLAAGGGTEGAGARGRVEQVALVVRAQALLLQPVANAQCGPQACGSSLLLRHPPVHPKSLICSKAFHAAAGETI